MDKIFYHPIWSSNLFVRQYVELQAEKIELHAAEISMGIFSIRCTYFESPVYAYDILQSDRELERVHIPFGYFKDAGWDVLLGASFVLKKNETEIGSASLWYGDLTKSGNYRWYEVQYNRRGLFSKKSRYLPTAQAASNIDKISFGPNPIDDENEFEFIEKWIRSIEISI